MASTYLTRTPSSAGNLKTFTISAWIKRADISTTLGTLLLCSYTSSSNYTNFYIGSGDKLTVNSSGTGSSCFIETNRLFRDASAWYHIVIAVDTTEGTASDRVKIYVNGVRETSFASTTYFGSSVNTLINSTVSTNINRNQYGTVQGSSSMSHFHLIDGTAYDATAFGEFDANGVWKIKTSPSVTYGTNGFFILKDGNSVTDQSGNSNNFTVGGGTLTNTEDSPSNVFATLNPLIPSSVTYSGGNLTAVIASSNSTASTLGAGTGKFYFETKLNDAENTYIGICSERNTGANFSSYRPLTESVLVNNSGTIYNEGGASGAKGLTGLADNDIIGCAFDVDNKKVWWSKNGQWYSGDANPATTITIADVEAGNNGYNFSSWTGQFVLGAQGTSTNANNISVNFGNGYFGTTAVASAGTNASGNGIFEYDVPTGYTALSTKGLNL